MKAHKDACQLDLCFNLFLQATFHSLMCNVGVMGLVTNNDSGEKNKYVKDGTASCYVPVADVCSTF